MNDDFGKIPDDESCRAMLEVFRTNPQPSPTAAPVQSGEPVVVEAWHGERKVTIYPDCVLRVWGTNIESEMSDEPRTLQTVQDAMDWLYAAPQPSQPVEAGEPEAK